jgi:hypothetical protein
MSNRPFEVVMAYLPDLDTTAIAYVLWPRTWWAGSDTAVIIPAETDVLTFDIRIDEEEQQTATAGYAIVVRDLVTNQIVWETGNVTRKATADDCSVIAVVPARSLTPRHYMAELTGQRDSDRMQVISRCPFEVLAR